jgi:hypothetical protein
MTKTNLLIILALLTFNYSSSGQTKCSITVDTLKILLNENLDNFITSLKSGTFQTSKYKESIPLFIKEQLNCLTNDQFSIANPKEEYRCCCTSSQKLPRRQLLFFSVSKDMFLVTYLTGGVGVSTHILMGRFANKKIYDIWSGYAFPKFKSKEDVIKYIKKERNIELGLHPGYVGN